MFKFFRLYNKIILVVGGIVLMIAFLLPQAVHMFAPNNANIKVGQVNGESVRQGEFAQATGEIRLLERLPLRLGMFTDDEVAWTLLQRDAAAMGLWASNAEVNAALGRLGYDAERLDQAARSFQTTPDGVRHVVRKFLIAEQYRRLVEGIAYADPGAGSPSPALNRVELVAGALQQVDNNVEMYQRFFASTVALQARGAYRLNTPLVRRTVRDNASSLSGRLTVLRPDPRSVPAPTEDRQQEIFNTYRDRLPGPSAEHPDDYPFGYRYPDRVRGRFLAISGAAIRAAVEVPYLDIKTYYNANQAEFADENGVSPDRPNVAARAAIKARLTQEKARALGDRIAADLAGQVSESVRGLPETQGYFDLPAGHVPLSLDAVAAHVQSKFNVAATVDGDPQQWVAVAELDRAPGIGSATVDSAGRIPFAAYAGAIRELADNPDDITRSLRTQIGLPGKTLRDFEGGVYLHLITAAEKSHPPATLDEVRDQVIADARTLAAFEVLATETAALRDAAVQRGIDAVARERGGTAVNVPAFERVTGINGQPPDLPEVGANDLFAQTAFDVVDGLHLAGDLQKLPVDERTIAMALKNAGGTPGVALFVANDYEPLTVNGYEQDLTGLGTLGTSLLLRDFDDPSPVSAEALATRTGFDLADYRGE